MPLMIVEKSTPSRMPGVEGRMFERDGMLLHPASGAFAQVDDIGMAIWDRVDGHRTIRQIVDALVEEFDAPSAQIAADVTAFLSELGTLGLIAFDR